MGGGPLKATVHLRPSAGMYREQDGRLTSLSPAQCGPRALQQMLLCVGGST